jgi:ribose transport system permease protein
MNSTWRQRFAKLQSLLALLIMFVALTLATDKFATADNARNVLQQISINLCLSIGMTLVILSGGIDLAVGSTLALAGAIAAGMLKLGIGIPLWDWLIQCTPVGAIVVAVAVGALFGLLSGVLITRIGLPPFIATLGMMSVGRGLTKLYTNGSPITALGEDFQFWKTQWLGLPAPVWGIGLLTVLFVLVTKKTRFGRYLYAIGGNEKAARLSGLRVRAIKATAYTLCGALAGLAGVLLAAKLDSATPVAGISYELDSIAAVVIGGTSLSGGRGSILGTVLGCLIIGVLSNGLVLLEVSPFWQEVIKGVVILLAVAVDRASRSQQD